MVEVEDRFSDLTLALNRVAKRNKLDVFVSPNLFVIIKDKSNKIRNWNILKNFI